MQVVLFNIHDGGEVPLQNVEREGVECRNSCHDELVMTCDRCRTWNGKAWNAGHVPSLAEDDAVLVAERETRRRGMQGVAELTKEVQ